MDVLDFQELLVYPTCLWYFLLNKQNISSNTPNNSGKQKSQQTLSLKVFLKIHLSAGGHCEKGTQGHHTVKTVP